MGHIAHLSNTGSYENTFRILILHFISFCPTWPSGTMILTNLLMHYVRLIDWLIIYGFTSRSLIWRRHHCRWRAAKFRPMLGTQGLWAGRDLYRATPAVTRDLGFSGLIRRTAQFSRLLRHTRGCGGSILTRTLTGHYVRKLSCKF
jgi:hypothetical protein